MHHRGRCRRGLGEGYSVGEQPTREPCHAADHQPQTSIIHTSSPVEYLNSSSLYCTCTTEPTASRCRHDERRSGVGFPELLHLLAGRGIGQPAVTGSLIVLQVFDLGGARDG